MKLRTFNLQKKEYLQFSQRQGEISGLAETIINVVEYNDNNKRKRRSIVTQDKKTLLFYIKNQGFAHIAQGKLQTTDLPSIVSNDTIVPSALVVVVESNIHHSYITVMIGGLYLCHSQQGELELKDRPPEVASTNCLFKDTYFGESLSSDIILHMSVSHCRLISSFIC